MKKRRVISLIAAAAAVAFTFGGCAGSQAVSEKLVSSGAGLNQPVISREVVDDLHTAVRSAMKKNDIEGLAIVVAAEDGSSWSAGFGSAGGGRAVTPETPFMLASVTKLFTAVAVMTLVEDGLVDLDAPIGNYVPEMDGASYPGARPPTVRELMTHHGGVVSDVLTGTLYSGPSAGLRDAFMDLVPIMAEQPLTEAPQTLAHYSNVGYTLLGALVTNVSGEPYTDYVDRRILGPLRMEDTGFKDPAVADELSRGFASGSEVSPLRMTGLPEAGLASSAADLGLFIRSLLGGVSVLKPETVSEMMQAQNGDVALDFDFQMGLGFHLMSLPGYPQVKVAWHDGGTHPFASTFVVAPDYGVGVAILSNSDENVPEALAYEAIVRVIESKTGRKLAKTSGYQFGGMAGRLLEPQELAGTYASEIGALLVSGKPRAPELTLSGMKLRLVPREQGSYGLQVRLLGFIPIPIADVSRIRLVFREIDGQHAVAYYEGGKFRSIALKVEPRPVPDAWKARYGSYVVANPDPQPFVTAAELGFNEELGFLTIAVNVAAIPDPVVLPLLAVDDSTLVSAGRGRRMGETFKVVTHRGGEAIRWAGLTLIPE